MKAFSADALEMMMRYSWPGNVRALRHSIERGVILSGEREIQAVDLQLFDPASSSQMSEPKANTPPSEELIIDSLNIKAMEKKLVALAMKKYKYNITKAAKALGLTRATLYRRIEEYDIE